MENQAKNKYAYLIGNQHAKGSKNNGRPVKSQEVLKIAVTNKCWDILKKSLTNPSVPEKTKLWIALEIAKKTAPTEINLNDRTERKELSSEQKIALLEVLQKNGLIENPKVIEGEIAE